VKKTTTYLALLFIAVSSIMLGSCNKDTSTPNPGGGAGGSYVITADINGQAWGADDGFAKYIAPFGLEIRGSFGNSSNIILNISPYNGMQTYLLNGINKITYREGGKEYTSTTGQIIITGDDGYYINGVFNAELISNSGGPALNFTNGEFYIPIIY
jgi:hypothetical protein